MNDEKLIELLKKYFNRGFYKFGYILLFPKDALEMADDLEKIQIPIMGITGWYYIDTADKNRGLAEDMMVDFYVGDNIWFGDNPVRESVIKVKSYLINHLPSQTAYVTLDLDISNWHEIYKKVEEKDD